MSSWHYTASLIGLFVVKRLEWGPELEQPVLGGTRQCGVTWTHCPLPPESQCPNFYKSYVSKLGQTLVNFISNISLANGPMEVLRREESCSESNNEMEFLYRFSQSLSKYLWSTSMCQALFQMLGRHWRMKQDKSLTSWSFHCSREKSNIYDKYIIWYVREKVINAIEKSKSK